MILFNLKTISKDRYYYPFWKMRVEFKGTLELHSGLRMEPLDLRVASGLPLGNV